MVSLHPVRRRWREVANGPGKVARPPLGKHLPPRKHFQRLAAIHQLFNGGLPRHSCNDGQSPLYAALLGLLTVLLSGSEQADAAPSVRSMTIEQRLIVRVP